VIITHPEKLTTLDIWFPRYSDQYKKTGEKVALLSCYKVDQASPVILVTFTKAQHLIGQRFAIKRNDAQRHPVDSNGAIACYTVPLSDFTHWDTSAEVRDIALGLFED
jgi:hypothetical protein